MKTDSEINIGLRLAGLRTTKAIDWLTDAIKAIFVIEAEGPLLERGPNGYSCPHCGNDGDNFCIHDLDWVGWDFRPNRSNVAESMGSLGVTPAFSGSAVRCEVCENYSWIPNEAVDWR